MENQEYENGVTDAEFSQANRQPGDIDYLSPDEALEWLNDPKSDADQRDYLRGYLSRWD